MHGHRRLGWGAGLRAWALVRPGLIFKYFKAHVIFSHLFTWEAVRCRDAVHEHEIFAREIVAGLSRNLNIFTEYKQLYLENLQYFSNVNRLSLDSLELLFRVATVA